MEKPLTICQKLVVLYSIQKEECDDEEWSIIQTAIEGWEAEAEALQKSETRAMRACLVGTCLFYLILPKSTPAFYAVWGFFLVIRTLLSQWHGQKFRHELGALKYRDSSYLKEPTPELLALKALKEARGLGGLGTNLVFSPTTAPYLLKG